MALKNIGYHPMFSVNLQNNNVCNSYVIPMLIRKPIYTLLAKIFYIREIWLIYKDVKTVCPCANQTNKSVAKLVGVVPAARCWVRASLQLWAGCLTQILIDQFCQVMGNLLCLL